MESHRILNCSCCPKTSIYDQIAKKRGEQEDGHGKRDLVDNTQGVESIVASKENLAILMELMMFAGKDVNVVDLFRMFKTIHTKAGYDERCPEGDWFDIGMKERFNDALSSLKYMGFVSATRQNTFLFKKNIFGKPKYYSA